MTQAPVGTVVARLREAIARDGRSKSEIARAAGVKVGTLTSWTRDEKSDVSAENLARVALVLRGVDPAWLLCGDVAGQRVAPADEAPFASGYRAALDAVQRAVAALQAAEGEPSETPPPKDPLEEILDPNAPMPLPSDEAIRPKAPVGIQRRRGSPRTNGQGN
jgi:transcriptional regulator with XRE-family HTH domain